MRRLLTWCFVLLFALSSLGASTVAAQTSKDTPSKGGTKTETKDTGTKKMEPVDINSASADELEAVKGIGVSTAKKIIAGRPYKGKDELVSKKIMSQSAYDKVKDQLVARQTTGAMPPPAAEKPAAKTETKKAAPSAAAPAPAKSESTKASTESAQTPPAKGMVWVNTDSKVFHREGDRWYGKTKQGKFMTESEALKEGYREAKQ